MHLRTNPGLTAQPQSVGLHASLSHLHAYPLNSPQCLETRSGTVAYIFRDVLRFMPRVKFLFVFEKPGFGSGPLFLP